MSHKNNSNRVWASWLDEDAFDGTFQQKQGTLRTRSRDLWEQDNRKPVRRVKTPRKLSKVVDLYQEGNDV